MVMFGIIAAFGGVLLFIAAAAQAVQSHNDATGFESVSGTVIRRGKERMKKGRFRLFFIYGNQEMWYYHLVWYFTSIIMGGYLWTNSGISKMIRTRNKRRH